jgi:predicted PurR-regulated permease PerM
MLSWIIQISLISIIFIFLVHHLITFFKTTLTVPKIKDLVNSSDKKYQKIYDTLSQQPNNQINSNSYTAIDLLPMQNDNIETNSMKDELKNFLKKQLNNETNNENTVVGLGTLNNFSSF